MLQGQHPRDAHLVALQELGPREGGGGGVCDALGEKAENHHELAVDGQEFPRLLRMLGLQGIERLQGLFEVHKAHRLVQRDDFPAGYAGQFVQSLQARTQVR